MSSRTITYRRERLYEEVWAEPVDLVAKRYDVSGVALAKICRKLSVPLPGRGYWARKRAGQKLRVPKLPPLAAGAREQITVTRQEPRPKPQLTPEAEARLAGVRAASATIPVGSTLDAPHKLVAMSAKLLRRAKPFDGVVTCRDERCLDISVSPAALDRALRIADALVRSLEALQLRVEVTEVQRPDGRRTRAYGEPSVAEEPSNATRVNVGGEWIRFAISERIHHRRPPPPPAPAHLKGTEAESWQAWHRPPMERIPSGELMLAIVGLEHLSIAKTWRDGKRRKIEDCLDEFVGALFVAAEAIKAHRAEQERRQRAWEEEQRRRWEAQQRREAEERQQKEFQETLARWRLSRDIQAYVTETRGLVEDAHLDITEGGALDEHLKWALSYAERIDPLCSLRVEIAKLVAEREVACSRARGETACATSKAGDALSMARRRIRRPPTLVSSCRQSPLPASCSRAQERSMPSGAKRMTTEPCASVADVAKHLGVACDSVYRWIEGRGLLAHERRGRR